MKFHLIYQEIFFIYYLAFVYNNLIYLKYISDTCLQIDFKQLLRYMNNIRKIVFVCGTDSLHGQLASTIFIDTQKKYLKKCIWQNTNDKIGMFTLQYLSWKYIICVGIAFIKLICIKLIYWFLCKYSYVTIYLSLING